MFNLYIHHNVITIKFTKTTDWVNSSFVCISEDKYKVGIYKTVLFKCITIIWNKVKYSYNALG